jgi:signal transduction histidine kinase
VATGDDTRFAQLVVVACHDLRTPLSTVFGFARTLPKTELDERGTRYVAMIDAASEELRELLDELSLVARIETGRFTPELEEADSLELARAAAADLVDDRLVVSGEGGPVTVPAREVTRALSRLGKAVARHGGHDSVDLVVNGAELRISPLSRTAEPVVLGREVRELSAAAAVALIEALGGSLRVDGEGLLITLPAAAIAA